MGIDSRLSIPLGIFFVILKVYRLSCKLRNFAFNQLCIYFTISEMSILTQKFVVLSEKIRWFLSAICDGLIRKLAVQFVVFCHFE